MKLLEDTGYEGPRHFDAHALRTEDEEGVWTFAKRLYANLPHPEREGRAVQQRLGHSGGARQLIKSATASLKNLSQKLQQQQRNGRSKTADFDREALGKRGPGLENLDQLTVELLLGVR